MCAYGEIMIKRAGKFSSKEIHATLFDKMPEPKTIAQMDAGIKRHLQQKHTRIFRKKYSKSLKE
jgi:hypothetical protein